PPPLSPLFPYTTLFRSSLAAEPGLPANGPPTVAIVAPSAGQTIEAATSVTFSWTVSDDVFVSSYLHVWANVTIGTETIPLLTDQDRKSTRLNSSHDQNS